MEGVTEVTQANEIILAEPDRPALSLDLPRGQSFEDWQALGRKLCSSSQVINWWIGDWWAAGQHRYGERAKAAAEGIFGASFGGLMNMASVCRSFETSRRRETLSWSHHVEVAALQPEQADAMLDQAEQEGWSKNELRRHVTAAHLRRSPAPEVANDYGLEPGGEDEPTPTMFTMDERVIELAEALGKERGLSDLESAWLEESWRKLRSSFGRQTEPWDGGQDAELKTHIRMERDVRMISTLMERTPAAIRRRLWKLGGIKRIIEEGSVAVLEAAE